MSRWRILLPFAAGSLQEDDYIDINTRRESDANPRRRNDRFHIWEIYPNLRMLGKACPDSRMDGMPERGA
ncbi:MAG: hypothetical protein KF682_18980 [Nitrospira sp.]|nr:hypothetical protein [Nitrospira sp.]